MYRGFLWVSFVRPKGRRPALPNIGGSLLFMRTGTPFVAELPNFSW